LLPAIGFGGFFVVVGVLGIERVISQKIVTIFVIFGIVFFFVMGTVIGIHYYKESLKPNIIGEGKTGSK